MKLFDRYKISLHNIKNNKSRSILTTIIVYVISLLIIAILSIAISFSNNMKSVIKQYYEYNDEPITIEYYHYSESGQTALNKDIYQNLSLVLEKNQTIISYLKYNNSTEYLISDHRFPINDYYEIIEGRNVSSLDYNTNRVLISANYANEYYINTGNKLNIGDSLEYTISYDIIEDNNSYYTNKSLTLDVEVVGIYRIKEVEKSSYYNNNVITKSNDIIIDVGYIFSSYPEFQINNATYYYNTTDTNFNSDELKNKLDVLVSELNEILPQNKYGDSVNSNALTDLKMSDLVGTIIIGLAAFLCLVLILLSIGSLANTIMISVDKNKKFIGLLKALGLNEKDLKSTIKMESITTIILGILLSFITLLIFNGLLANLNDLLINLMLSNYVNEINYIAVYNLPIYIPIIVFIFFVAFTLLFARSSMSKIAKTDPMAVISEVA